MAYRRSITARSNLFYQLRLSPSISHSHRHHNVSQNSEASPISRNPNYIHHRFLLGAGNSNFSNFRRFAVPAGYGMACGRNYWSEADKTEVVGVLGDKSVEVAPVANEVAVAAADAFPPVAAFQYLIDYVHCFTGLSWWASIAATTIIVRLLDLPFVINTMTSRISRHNSLMAKVDEMSNEGGLCPTTFAEAQAKLEALSNEYGAPYSETIINVSVYGSFFFAVLNMAKEVPSFKEGGALWFTDLTTPDTSCLLPVLTALTCWHMLLNIIAFEKSISPDLGHVKVSGQVHAFAAFTIPVAACFPKAILCFWITSNLFSVVVYGFAIKNARVKKLLGIPIAASTNQKSKKGGK